jgi:hypothetical protein
VLLTVDLYQDFVDVEGVAVSSMLSFKTPRILRTKLDTPEANGFAADCDATFSEEIFNIPETEIEPEIEPISIADDVGGERLAGIDGACMYSSTELPHFR